MLPAPEEFLCLFHTLRITCNSLPWIVQLSGHINQAHGLFTGETRDKVWQGCFWTLEVWTCPVTHRPRVHSRLTQHINHCLTFRSHLNKRNVILSLNCSWWDRILSIYGVILHFPKWNNCIHAWILAGNPYRVSWLKADTKLSVRGLKNLPCSPLSDILRPGWIAVPQAQWKSNGECQSHCHCFA